MIHTTTLKGFCEEAIVLASFVKSLFEVVIIYLIMFLLNLLLCYYFGFVTRVVFDFGAVDNAV